MADRMVAACAVAKYIKENCWFGAVSMQYRVDDYLQLEVPLQILRSHPYFKDCVDAIKSEFPFVGEVTLANGGYEVIVHFNANQG